MGKNRVNRVILFYFSYLVFMFLWLFVELICEDKCNEICWNRN